jgi:hypothetical protein
MNPAGGPGPLFHYTSSPTKTLSLYDAPEEQRVMIGRIAEAVEKAQQRPPEPLGIDFARLEEEELRQMDQLRRQEEEHRGGMEELRRRMER